MRTRQIEPTRNEIRVKLLNIENDGEENLIVRFIRDRRPDRACQKVTRQASGRPPAGHPASLGSRERTHSASASDRGAGNEKCEWRRESEKNGFPYSIAKFHAPARCHQCRPRQLSFGAKIGHVTEVCYFSPWHTSLALLKKNTTSQVWLESPVLGFDFQCHRHFRLAS